MSHCLADMVPKTLADMRPGNGMQQVFHQAPPERAPFFRSVHCVDKLCTASGGHYVASGRRPTSAWLVFAPATLGVFWSVILVVSWQPQISTSSSVVGKYNEYMFQPNDCWSVVILAESTILGYLLATPTTVGDWHGDWAERHSHLTSLRLGYSIMIYGKLVVGWFQWLSHP